MEILFVSSGFKTVDWHFAEIRSLFKSLAFGLIVIAVAFVIVFVFVTKLSIIAVVEHNLTEVQEIITLLDQFKPTKEQFTISKELKHLVVAEPTNFKILTFSNY